MELPIYEFINDFGLDLSKFESDAKYEAMVNELFEIEMTR